MNRLFVTVLASSFLLSTGGAVWAQTARAMSANTPIRGEAGLESAIIATVPEGAVLEVVDFQGDWYRVVVPAEQAVTGTPQVGYVWSRLLEIVNADAASVRPRTPPGSAPPTSLVQPLAEGPMIPPVLTKLPVVRDKAAEREQALKADVDARRAELEALQNASLAPANADQRVTPAFPAEPQTPRNPNVTRIGGTGEKKIWIDVNIGGAQSAQGAQAFTFATTLNRQPAAFASAYGAPSGGTDFDFGGGYMFTPTFGLGLSITSTGDQNAAGLIATIPHPTISNATTTTSGVTSTELERAEAGFNIQLAVFPRLGKVLGDRTRVRLFGGPTYFRLSRQMVDAVRYTQQFGVFTSVNLVSIVGADARVVEGTGWGFHAGADVDYFFSRYAGVGGTLRFSRGSVEMAEPLSETTAEMTTGGTQFGGGLRLRF